MKYILAIVLSLITLPAFSQGNIITKLASNSRVDKVYTSVNDIAIVELPEPVISAAIGSEEVHMEYSGNRVLVQPLSDGIDTDLIVFTEHLRMTFDIMPANSPAQITYMLEEAFPPVLPPPPGPTPLELQQQRDNLLDSVLLSSRVINVKQIKNRSQRIIVKVDMVSEDASSYYVRLIATNRDSHAYRIQTPGVNKIDPVFGLRLAYSLIGRQINAKTFNRFRLYDESPLVTHGSTLIRHDLQPGESAEWVMAVNKPKASTAMYEFMFPSDRGVGVHAIAIF